MIWSDITALIAHNKACMKQFTLYLSVEHQILLPLIIGTEIDDNTYQPIFGGLSYACRYCQSCI